MRYTKLDMYSVAYVLKARTLEPEKQPLLVNGSETTVVSRQWLDKHVLAAMDKHATIDVFLETVFSTLFMQRDYKEDNGGNRVIPVREPVEKSVPLEGIRRSERKNLHC
jgi:hypothetical protein